jgi:predicted acylesterase/phospholipase RssA
MNYGVLTRDEHFELPGPKRILTLDGGGLRGIVSLGYLARLESILRSRYRAGDDFRLCHYFDLIAGTSTGAIIAAGLATNMRVTEITDEYLKLGREVFKKRWLSDGLVRERYDKEKLSEQLRAVFGPTTTLGGRSVRTGLLIMAKRLDTGSAWPIGNNPRGKYYTAPDDADWVSNADYPLWQVVRASTAAPTFFAPEKISIGLPSAPSPEVGHFVDGGVSPYNNPALQTFMYATLEGFQIGWPTGEDRIQLVSVGTGAGDPGMAPAWLSGGNAAQALLSLMSDCSDVVEILMQWMSKSPTAREIDGEIGGLAGDLIAPEPLLTYLRYDLDLGRKGIDTLMPGLTDKQVKRLPDMDRPENLEILKTLGERAAERDLLEAHFDERFDLHRPTVMGATSRSRPGIAMSARRRYRRREGATVVAVRLDLETDGFTYEKWGGTQTCSSGDWLVRSDGETYTVEADTFARTYREVSPGVFEKATEVWAEVAEEAGEVRTKEGFTRYEKGDFIVSNDPHQDDAYAMSKDRFDELYEAAD